MESSIGQLPLHDLAGRCRGETEKFRRGEPSCDRFCLELLRRAICDADQLAWHAAFEQYRGMVLAWVRLHPAGVAAAAVGDDDDWVNRTFERFWSAIGPTRFATFPSLAALLRYLKLCTHSVLLDVVRALPARPHEPLDDQQLAVGTSSDFAAVVLDELERQELWQAISGELHDEGERLVARLCLTLGMKPREVYSRHPQQFASVLDVYRVKRNLLDRLRHSSAIRAFWA